MTHPKFVERIADIYTHKYHKEGMSSAAAYAERITAGNGELSAAVRDTIIARATKRGPSNGNKPA